ncbi:DUF6597 domain-containing transcriptional factor, partial [Roseisolibacter sp. H3M3-2]|uniref:DUF6597 domain-containing transcriptional factor n=1 Tax=Roseisolibacter sp. H3M3-2 TaxID=3031323 RepID=UPI0023DC8544
MAPALLTEPPSPADAAAPTSGRLTLAPAPPDLDPLVEYLWQLELPAGATPDAYWRVVVDGYVDVAVRLPLDAALVDAAARAGGTAASRRDLADAIAASPTLVCGAATTTRTIPLSGPVLLTGVRFRLGHAGRLLHTSAAGRVDGARPLRDVLVGRGAGDAARALASSGASPAPAEDPADRVLHGAALRAFARGGAVGLARRLVSRIVAMSFCGPR